VMMVIIMMEMDVLKIVKYKQDIVAWMDHLILRILAQISNLQMF
jgi:hypothetical protein